jgi:hypothetical protein
MKTLSGKPRPLAARAHDMMDEAVSVVLDGCWSVLDGPP